MRFVMRSCPLRLSWRYSTQAVSHQDLLHDEKSMASCTSVLSPGREVLNCHVTTQFFLAEIPISYRLRDREMLRKRKEKAQEKNSAYWIYR